MAMHAHGKWSVTVVPPLWDRRTQLHLVRSEPARSEGDKALRVVPPQAFEVVHTLVPLAEGKFADHPTWFSDGSPQGDEDLRNLLQTIVDAAHELGIVATAQADHRAEIVRMSDHLDDMRRVAFSQLPNSTPPLRKGS